MSADPASGSLDLSVKFVRGIGPRRFAALEKYGVHTVYDLLLYVPRRYLDRTAVVSIRDLRNAVLGPVDLLSGNEASLPLRKDYTVVGDVRSFRVMGMGPRSRFVLILGDRTGTMQCVWFGGVQYWKKAFRVGETLAVSGQPSSFAGTLQFVHPDIDRIAVQRDEPEAGTEGDDDAPGEEGGGIDWAARLNTGGLVPLYPSGQDLTRVGLDSAGFRRVIHGLLGTRLGEVREFLPSSLMADRKLVPLAEAIRGVHFPRGAAELQEGIRRLKYQELFLFELMLALKRRAVHEEHDGIAFDVKSPLARRLVDSLPFTLTRAQVRVIKEITADMANGRPMNRLLQGDVGSGKTVVALTAMLIAADNGWQSAFLAPTEILAEQHYKTLAELLQGMPVTMRLLVGAQRSRLRRDVLEDVRNGTAQIVVGTHALLEKTVSFHQLGFVVIDEQHRFGVLQRATLREKGTNPDVLVMTATPIPRTLSLTLYGDLDVSVIDELPKDRKPIRTTVSDDAAKESVFRFVREQVAGGRQAYFVYPLVEESEALELKAATSHLAFLQQEVFPDLRLGLLHGRMPSEEKDAVMMAFKRGEIQVLVATTVIEVGIDVPNATVMVIENAERFGLSQLHQLRGRVGRSAHQAYCILLTKQWIAQRARRGAPGAPDLSLDQQRQAERRLAAMVETTDGFKIAEMDLQLRGPGDFFGTRQSGIPAFRVADLLTDTAILETARADAFALVERDPSLALPEHRSLASHLRMHLDGESALIKVG
ncbi:MAG TPA: ATP-dependent DNA helicase RecG [Bacteroidota bacterium]